MEVIVTGCGCVTHRADNKWMKGSFKVVVNNDKRGGERALDLFTPSWNVPDIECRSEWRIRFCPLILVESYSRINIRERFSAGRSGNNPRRILSALAYQAGLAPPCAHPFLAGRGFRSHPSAPQYSYPAVPASAFKRLPMVGGE
jgi:hypothetical protein